MIYNLLAHHAKYLYTPTATAAPGCTNGNLQLVGGRSSNEGRVEICINGVWGSLSDYGWDSNDARVVCRQLGYSVNTGRVEMGGRLVKLGHKYHQ